MNKIKEKISFFIIFFIALVCSSVICFSSGNKVEAWSGWADSLYYNVSNQPSGSGYSGSQFLLTVSSSGTYGQNDGGFYYLGNNAHLSVQISRMAYYETAKLSSWNDAVWSYNWCNADWNDDWDDLNDMGHPNPLSHRDIRCIYDENQKLNKNGEVSSSNEMYGNIESPAYLADIKGEYYLWILLGWETEGYYDQYSDKDYALISVREPASQETYDVQASHIPHYLYHLNPKHPSGGMYAYTYKFFLVDDAGFADERHECDRDTGLGYMLCYYSNQFPYSTHGALANVVNDQLSNPIYTSKSDLSSKEGFDFESRHDYIGDSVTINRSDLGVSYTMIAAVSNTKVNLGQLLVRGEDAIIFPDKYDNIDTYNKGYVYRTCKTYKKILGIKTNKCKEWNDYKYYEVYKDSSSHKVDNNGNLIYSDLEAVKMVMPSFEINLETSDKLSLGNGIPNMYNMKGKETSEVKDNYVFEQKRQYLNYGQGCWLDNCTEASFYIQSQVLFDVLVIYVEAEIRFYGYSGSLGDGNTINDVKEYSAKSAVYYIMYQPFQNGGTEGNFQSVNGYSPDAKERPERRNYIPVNFDFSPLLNPRNWSEVKEVGTAKVLNSTLKSGQLRDTLEVNGTNINVSSPFVATINDKDYGEVYVRALGIMMERNYTVSLDVDGSFYVESEDVSISDVEVVAKSASNLWLGKKLAPSDSLIKDGSEYYYKNDVTLSFNMDRGKYFVSKIEYNVDNSKDETITSSGGAGDFVTQISMKQSKKYSKFVAQCFLSGSTSIVSSIKLNQSGLLFKDATYTPPGCATNNMEFLVGSIKPNAQEVKQIGFRDFAEKSDQDKFNSNVVLENVTGSKNIKISASDGNSKLVIIRVTIDANENGKIDSVDLNTYYVVVVDKSAPEIPTSGDVEGDYIIVRDEKELDTIVYDSSDDLMEFEITSSKLFDYIWITAKDKAGNTTSHKFKIIVDNHGPDEIDAILNYDNKTQQLNDSEKYVDLTVDFTYGEPADFSADDYEILLTDVFTKEKLSVFEPKIVSLEDEDTSAGVEFVGVAKDYDNSLTNRGISGILGMFYKIWSEESSEAPWKFIDSDTLTINQFNQDEVNYIAIIPVDKAYNLFKQKISSLSAHCEEFTDDNLPEVCINPKSDFYSTIDIRIYAIRVSYAPYITNVIATDEGFGFVTNDNSGSFIGKNPNIKKILLMDKNVVDNNKASFDSMKTYISSVFTNSENSLSVVYPSNPYIDNSINNATVTFDETGNTDYLSYLKSKNGGLIKYSSIHLNSSIPQLNSFINEYDYIDADNVGTFDSMMLINGLLLSKSYIFVEIEINEDAGKKTIFQYVSFADVLSENSKENALLSMNHADDINLENRLDNNRNSIVVNGNDVNSRLVDNDMELKYKLNLVYGENVSFDAYHYRIYYKICYEQDSMSGNTVLNCGEEKLYEYGSNLVIEDMLSGDNAVLYHVLVRVVTALEFDSSQSSLISRYNHEEGYGFINDNVEDKVCENEHYAETLVEDHFEYDYAKFIYDTSTPTIKVEYVPVSEYKEDGINKLKDHQYLTDVDNYLLKVTLNNPSDKYKKPEEWLNLNNFNVYWFPYYQNTGKSVCGDISRLECEGYLDTNLFNIISAKDNLTSYPSEGLVYYFQYPLSKNLKSVNENYSVDVVDLMIKVKNQNGTTNNGMSLVVDEIERKSNVEFLTIHYDQDAPEIAITSSPTKSSSYYSISIATNDVSSNVEKVELYYGIYGESDSYLINSQYVNSKEYAGYSAKLTQKGWYSVVATDELGLVSVKSFEVVRVNEGVMYSPTLDDTDQLQDTNTITVIIATIVSIIVSIGIIALVIGLVALLLWLVPKVIKLRKVKKAADKTKQAGKDIKNTRGKENDLTMESKTGKFLKRIFRPVRRDDYQMDISEMQNQNNDEEGEE